jgi:YVTN family beta-propeller protein
MIFVHRLRSLAITLVFTVGLVVFASAGTVRIYITNSAGDSVDVIDSATNKVVQVISGIEVPHGVKRV